MQPVLFNFLLTPYQAPEGGVLCQWSKECYSFVLYYVTFEHKQFIFCCVVSGSVIASLSYFISASLTPFVKKVCVLS